MIWASTCPAQTSWSSPHFSGGDRGLCDLPPPHALLSIPGQVCTSQEGDRGLHDLGPPRALLSLCGQVHISQGGTEACVTWGLHAPCSAFVVKSTFLRVGIEACVTWGLHTPCSAFMVQYTCPRGRQNLCNRGSTCPAQPSWSSPCFSGGGQRPA